MGTTAEKLTYLNTTKQLIKESINLTDANITTQPFRQYATILKHRLPEIVGDPSIIWNNYEHVSGTGTSFSITAYNSIFEYQLKGNTTQNGTPTPTSPIPINVVSGDNKITISDGTNSVSYPLYLGVENLFDLTNIQNNGTSRTSFVINDNNIVMTATTGGTYRYIYKQIDNLTIGQPYTIKIGSYNDTSTNKLAQWGITTTGGQYYGNVKTLSNTQTLTITPTETSIQFRIGYLTNSCSANDTLTVGNIQLEKGSKSNAYTPYGTTPIELCKIGTYQDYIYKDNGSWYLHKEIGKVVLNGSETIETQATSSGKYRFAVSGPNDMKTTNELNVPAGLLISNKFIEISNATSLAGNTNGILVRANNTKQFMINCLEAGAYTIAQFKTWLENNNILVYYTLANSTNTEINNIELISQLNAVSLITGLNNITVSGDLPATLDLTAIKYE